MKIIKPPKQERNLPKFSMLHPGDVLTYDGSEKIFMKLRVLRGFNAVNLSNGTFEMFESDETVVKLEAELKIYGEKE